MMSCPVINNELQSDKHKKIDNYFNTDEYRNMQFIIQFVLYKEKDSKEFVDRPMLRDINHTYGEFLKVMLDFDLKVDEIYQLCKIKKTTPDVIIKEILIEREESNNATINILNKNKAEDVANACKGKYTLFKYQLEKFVNKCFNLEFENINFVAISEVKFPVFVKELNDDVRDVFTNIFNLWSDFARCDKVFIDYSRELDSNVSDNSNTNSSRIPLSDIYFLPGGRFRECYYWDSYWIIKGLLACNLEYYAFRFIKSFVGVIDTLGYIPNGLRKYYLGRSHPPFFSHMIYLLYKKTNNPEIKSYLLDKGLKACVKEYEWFMKNRRFSDNNYRLNMYWVDDNSARPESSKEDFEQFIKVQTKDLYSNIRSGAESGWDYSSRWFEDGESLNKIILHEIIPVDLNGIMYQNELIIHFLYSEVYKSCSNFGITSKFEKQDPESTSAMIKQFEGYMHERVKSIEKILWNEEVGCYNDYNFVTNQHNSKHFYISNLFFLFFYDDIPDNKLNVYDILYNFREVLFGYEGGIPASDKKVSKCPQQWDFPNVWAPYVEMFCDFLLKIGFQEGALHVAKSLFNSVKKGYDEHKIFFEKYNCQTAGKIGGGGEYNAQSGFGWTNGTIASFIEIFKNDLSGEFNHAKSYIEITKILKERKLSKG